MIQQINETLTGNVGVALTYYKHNEIPEPWEDTFEGQERKP